MNNTDLNYSLKRLTNASNKLLECEKEIEALSEVYLQMAEAAGVKEATSALKLHSQSCAAIQRKH